MMFTFPPKMQLFCSDSVRLPGGEETSLSKVDRRQTTFHPVNPSALLTFRNLQQQTLKIVNN